ncbi:MAG: SDR family oxidoreductase, partial [Deltaproteobacteria bacterium]|nr:SDR family oxidoreductase [Deltaproteobacteria bacterium]
MFSIGKLKGKVAVITGASRGIGRSLARGFAHEGAKLYLVGHKDKDALRETLDEVKRDGAEADGTLCDVGSYPDVVHIAEAVERRYGTLDILVNNAGTISPTSLLEITPEQWDKTVRTHLHGTFYCTVEMVKRFLKPKRAGKVVNVTAPSAVRGSNGVADYASAKGGIIAFTRNAARELLPLNIQVNAVLPVARSRMTDALAQYHARFSGDETAARLRNLASPDVLLPVFLFLASSD